MEIAQLIVTVLVCLFGSGGLVLYLLKRNDTRSSDIAEIKEGLSKLQEGLIMALENDKVIFKALREHSINGESEAQEEKMDEYFLKAALK